MRLFERRARAVVVVAAATGALLPASQAGAVTFDNACTNSILTSQASLIPVTMTAAAPSSVPPGATFGLSQITQTLEVPPGVFVNGYQLGLLTVGPNTIPATVKTVIAGTNTAQGTQATDLVSTSISTTISDPTPSSKFSGDETATPGTLSATYANQGWTASGADGSPIAFREATIPPAKDTGGIVLNATIKGVPIQFRCSPGEVVEGANPSTIQVTDPAVAFAGSLIAASAPAPAPPATTPSPTQTTPTAPTTGASVPAISSARLSNKVFRAAATGASLTAKRAPIGTDITYTASQASRTTFAVLKAATGHRKGARCLAGRAGKGQKPCTRQVSVGSFTHQDVAGKVKVHFTGRVRGRKLSPGTYRLTLTPVALGKKGATVTLAFRIVK